MSMTNGFDREVRFKIVERIGVLSTHSTGWNKELNLVSWNGGQPKYDIRDWDLAHEHMSRGVTLHEKEMRQIFDLMKKRRMENRFRREERQGVAEEPFEAPLKNETQEEPFEAPLKTETQEESFEAPLRNETLEEATPELLQQE